MTVHYPSQEEQDYYQRVFSGADEKGRGVIDGVHYDLNLLPVEAVRQMRRMAEGLEQYGE